MKKKCTWKAELLTEAWMEFQFVVGHCYVLLFLRPPWTEDPVARQAPLSMGFPRQEYWSGLPFPSQWDLPN